tara:strand:+ start:110001 stop:110978 length:978 start_codon:yes stop_codon:yes gene_type:complete
MLALLTPVLMLSPIATATEPEDLGNKYEDDAWYDISEWFDGNDYNPTDEALGRWDDEKFSREDAQSSFDQDSDVAVEDAETFYGRDYDDGYHRFYDNNKDGNYEAYSRFYDADGDNLYEGYAYYRDENNDGIYEDYKYSELSTTDRRDVNSRNVAQSAQKGLSGKAEKISGTAEETKMVTRFGRASLLVHVKADDGKDMWVDLGQSSSTLQIFKGDQLTAMGPVVKAGNKDVLVATTIEQDGEQRNVERFGRQYEGTIKSTRKATVRGQEHVVAKLETENGKMMTVDMGQPDSVEGIKEGKKVSVTGVPVKIGDRVILVADQNSL